tara:strand:+ start:1218 stop:1835 length:618 start_codon:yes stop_codon:yes gene_type:complete
MPTNFTELAFTPTVQAEQDRLGSRAAMRRLEALERRTAIDPDLAQFVQGRDSFYLGSASADGRPYIQHRGGPRGFLKVIDEHNLAFADFSGNRQYITLGNLAENDRAFIFLMDYANRRRIKLWGRARVVEDDAELLASLSDMDYGGRPERAIVFAVEAWDINCNQHISQRFGEAEIAPTILALKSRIGELEAEVARLRQAHTKGH